MYSNEVEDYLKNQYYFQDLEENDENTFSKLNLQYFELAKKFRQFVLRYDIRHKYISKSVLLDIIKRLIEYILHRRQSEYDTDSDELILMMII